MDICKNKGKVAGLLICIVIGLLVLIPEIFLSNVNLPPLADKKLKEYDEGWTVSVRDLSYENTILPFFAEEAELGDTLVLNKRLPAKIENDTYLFFRASHQKVKAYIDGEAVYRFGWDEGRSYGKSPACAWILVPVLKEQAGKQIQIELTGAYASYAGKINDFYLGDKSSVLIYIAKDRLASIFICMALIIMGFSMMITAFILRNGKAVQSLFRLGVLSVLVGIWSTFTLNILQMLMGDVFVLLNMEFVTFLLLLPTTLWFLESFDHYKNQKILQIIFWGSVILAVTIHLLQFFNIADYMETLSASHVLIVVSIIYFAFSGLKECRERKECREVRILTVSVILTFLFSGLDLLKFYFYITFDDGFFTRIGMLLFIIIWASEIIQNMSRLIIKMTQTRMLETLAYQDQMTNLKNRSAFEEKLTEYRKGGMDEVYIVAFDMNDLKGINDNYGHAIGDQAIRRIANILKTEFEENGICYRIGGDEFCVMIPNASAIPEQFIIEKIERVKAEVHMIGEEQHPSLSLAGGFSKATGKEGQDIDSAYRQADKKMYVDKQRMKLEESACG